MFKRIKKAHRNKQVLKNQPDEVYNPQAIYPVKVVSIGQDDPLYKLGSWFQSLGYYDRFKITFERYVRMVENGTWKDLARN